MYIKCDRLVKHGLHALLSTAISDGPAGLLGHWGKDTARVLAGSLPLGLRADLSSHWNLTAEAWPRLLDEAMRSSPPGMAFSTLQWYEKAAAGERLVCWPHDVQHALGDYDNMLGAVAAALVDPASIKELLQLRFMDLPPGVLNTSRPHCFAHDINYEPWEGFIRMLSPSDEDDVVKLQSLRDIRDLLDSRAGHHARVLFHATRETYQCSRSAKCSAERIRAHEFVPYNREEALTLFETAVQSRRGFCYLFDRVVHDDKGFWIFVG